ncbi:MAG: secretin N-terminal domain-containing protein [Candidatus Omnitrophota bacterium]|nr:secretin N-terminal domain-containing protein [Candidatus Omnitrophota bacterium]
MINKIRMRVLTFFIVPALILQCGQGYLLAASSPEDLLGNKENVRVTLDLKDASLRDVLKMLSVQSGLNFISSEAVADRRITLFLDNVMLKAAMDKIFAVNNLTYELDRGSNIFIVKDWGSPSLEVDTRVYFLKYVAVTNSRIGTASGGMRDALGSVISTKGKIIEDPATNSIIITDMPSKFPVIEKVIANLDVSVPQVMIEVEILDVDKSDVDKLGLKFSGTDWLKYSGPNFGAIYPFSGATLASGLLGDTGSTRAAWNMSSLTVALDFLQTRSSTKFLARPKIFVLNNETAELKLSANEAIGSQSITAATGSTAATTTVAAERAQTGVSLKVTPQISMATGEITMTLEPTVKEAVTGLTIGTQTTKDVEERSFKSTIRIKDGQTVILGGLIRKKSTFTGTNVPFFSEIPILGMFFRHKEDGPRKDREILVFITPRIMRNQPQPSTGEVAVKKSVIPKIIGEREQDPFVDIKRKEIVSQVLRGYEVKK